MTEISKEILGDYEIRKTRAQKTRFIGYITAKAESMGYSARVEKGSFGARNIVFGDPDTAKAVFTAHYDTCAGILLPNLITPKNILLYLLYQLALVIYLLLPPMLLGFGLGVALSLMGMEVELAASLGGALAEIGFVWALLKLIFGPANKHTANDNTSGVITIVDIMQALPEEKRSEVAFVLFDLEEVGLIGSSSFASRHRSHMKSKLLINFDCVGDGDSFLFLMNKRSKRYADLLTTAYGRDGAEILSKGAFYPSDNAAFPCSVGVGAFKRTRSGILYMDRIHTSRDTVCNEENISYLTASSVSFVEQITENLERF